MATKVTKPREKQVKEIKKTAPKKSSTPKPLKFWKGRIAIKGVGTVQGEVQAEHWATFCALLNPESNPVSFTSDIDIIAKAKKEAMRKYKKKHTGLDE